MRIFTLSGLACFSVLVACNSSEPEEMGVACQHVNLNELLAAPEAFDDVFVCSTAIATPRQFRGGDPWDWLAELTPPEGAEATPWPLGTSFGSGEFLEGEELPYSGPPVVIEFAGLFYFDEECLDLIEISNDAHQCHFSPIGIDMVAFEIVGAP